MSRRITVTMIAMFAVVGILPFATGATAAPAAADRIAGRDRFETAVEISKELIPTVPAGGIGTLFIASGQDYPDALAAGPAAASEGTPVLLVRQHSVPIIVGDEIKRLNPNKIVVLGGVNAVSAEAYAELDALTDKALTRIEGETRYETAAAISRFAFPNGNVDVVYVASGATFPDALAGGAAAGVAHGPILLTRPAELPAATATELVRLKPKAIIVLGGTAAISAAVFSQINDYTPANSDTVRVAGADRYETSALVAENRFKTVPISTVYLSSGQNFPDALAGAPLAASAGAPILLVRSDRVDPAVCEEVKRLQPTKVVALGGTNPISAAVLEQVAQDCVVQEAPAVP